MMIRVLRGHYWRLVLVSAFLCAHSVCSSQEPIPEAVQSSFASEEAQGHADALQFVRLPASALPKNVQLVQEIRTVPLIPAVQNPDVFVDSEQIMSLARFFGVREESDLKPVKFGVVAIYQESDPEYEIGVYGLCFAEEKIAKTYFEKLAKNRNEPPYILKGKLLLYVWKDSGVSSSAFESVRDYLRRAGLQAVQR